MWQCKHCLFGRNFGSRLTCYVCGTQRTHPSKDKPLPRQSAEPTRRLQPERSQRDRTAASQESGLTQSTETGELTTTSEDVNKLEKEIVALRSMLQTARTSELAELIADLEVQLKLAQAKLQACKPVPAQMASCITRLQQREKQVQTLETELQDLNDKKAKLEADLDTARSLRDEQAEELTRLRRMEAEPAADEISQVRTAAARLNIGWAQLLEVLTMAAQSIEPMEVDGGTKREADAVEAEAPEQAQKRRGVLMESLVARLPAGTLTASGPTRPDGPRTGAGDPPPTPNGPPVQREPADPLGR